MRIPLKWLNDYVDISSVSVEELESKLFSCGFEVEEVIKINENVNKIVTCRILEKSRHPAADKLFVCQVDAGGYGNLQIVTNAVNVKEGDIVPVALDGATLADGTVIKDCKMRGVLSQGMFCGGEEIGITEEYYDGAGGDSVLIFHDEFAPGEEVPKLLDIKDVVFDINVTANRPDCQSVFGIAREVAAILKKPLKTPNISYSVSNADTKDFVNVSVLDSELCPRYMACYVSDVKIAPSPKWMQRRLALMGIRAINNVVDITNYVLNEIGQPMHAFDYRELTGQSIVVRRAVGGEKIVTLDEKEFTLDNNVLVICDKDKPSALAGIMGGFGSGVKDDTSAIVFESAKFKRDNIRKTSRVLNQRSDSSARFEKGVDAYSNEFGLKRALALIDELGAGKVAKSYLDVNSCSPDKKVISTSMEKIDKLLGIEVPEKEVEAILTRLDFDVTLRNGQLTVKVPLYREDVEDYPDLAEEIIRSYGYDHIENKLLDNCSITPGGRTKAQVNENCAIKYLASIGFSEIITYSFISPKDYLKFGYDLESLKAIKLKNPLGEDLSIMRTTLIPSIVATVERNLNRKNNEGRLFELAKVYIPEKLPLEDLPTEKLSLSMALFGENEDFFTAKGAVEGLLSHLCFDSPLRFERSKVCYLHPSRSADIYAGDELIGFVGELHPEKAAELGLDKKVYVAELDYENIKDRLTRAFCVKVFSKFPQVERDLALVCDTETTNADILAAISAAGIKNLISVRLFDVYTGDKIAKGKKSLAYRLTFSSLEKTLDDDEIERYIAKILRRLEEIGVKLR